MKNFLSAAALLLTTVLIIVAAAFSYPSVTDECREEWEKSFNNEPMPDSGLANNGLLHFDNH